MGLDTPVGKYGQFNGSFLICVIKSGQAAIGPLSDTLAHLAQKR